MVVVETDDSGMFWKQSLWNLQMDWMWWSKEGQLEKELFFCLDLLSKLWDIY